jgi:hypothetical protein
MTTISKKFDPWGPISSVLYEYANSDLVQNAIGKTGIEVEWQPQSRDEKFSHATRIRAYRRDIASAYAKLDDDQKGHFAQIVVKAMLRWQEEFCRRRLGSRLIKSTRR